MFHHCLLCHNCRGCCIGNVGLVVLVRVSLPSTAACIIITSRRRNRPLTPVWLHLIVLHALSLIHPSNCGCFTKPSTVVAERILQQSPKNQHHLLYVCGVASLRVALSALSSASINFYQCFACVFSRRQPLASLAALSANLICHFACQPHRRLLPHHNFQNFIHGKLRQQIRLWPLSCLRSRF